LLDLHFHFHEAPASQAPALERGSWLAGIVSAVVGVLALVVAVVSMGGHASNAADRVPVQAAAPTVVIVGVPNLKPRPYATRHR
jgi:nicotinamide riboside transporter PnuC